MRTKFLGDENVPLGVPNAVLHKRGAPSLPTEERYQMNSIISLLSVSHYPLKLILQHKLQIRKNNLVLEQPK